MEGHIFCWSLISPTLVSVPDKRQRGISWNDHYLYIYHTILYIYVNNFLLLSLMEIFFVGCTCSFKACIWPAINQNTMEVGVNWVHDIQSKNKNSCTLSWQKILYIYLQRLSSPIVGKSSFFFVASCVRFVIQLKNNPLVVIFLYSYGMANHGHQQLWKHPLQ